MSTPARHESLPTAAGQPLYRGLATTPKAKRLKLSQQNVQAKVGIPRIESLKVENYRALRHVQLDKLTPMTVLLGPNGSGKSTLLKVIAGDIEADHLCRRDGAGGEVGMHIIGHIGGRAAG